MYRLDHGCYVVAEGFNYLETLGLVVCLVILINGIVNTHFDADSFFFSIRNLGRL